MGEIWISGHACAQNQPVFLFLAAGLASIYPTLEFQSWGKALKAGQVPVVDAGNVRKIRSIMHWELVGVVLLILCAALMARGAGHIA